MPILDETLFWILVLILGVLIWITLCRFITIGVAQIAI